MRSSKMDIPTKDYILCKTPKTTRKLVYINKEAVSEDCWVPKACIRQTQACPELETALVLSDMLALFDCQ